jgi:predicted nucleic acid-binding protein
VSKCFIDTNILVYTADRANEKKREHARIFVKHQVEETDVVISTQVLQEFYVAATKKLSIPVFI